ncbi:MAG TPA: glycosyltransferase family 2 protein [Patescibacteria group bacterium]|nr:glycosyltransferase family 2 protein [Patescibacteria group bacterium]
MPKLISIIIPCYNEEKNINRTFEGILELAKAHHYDFEIIAVNDGSKDNTWLVIEEFSHKHPEIKGINLMTNFGQSAAYMAGFDAAKGDYVITYSADLETPINNINRVIEYLDHGYDFVNSNRLGRWGAEKAERAAKSGLANKIISRVSGVYMNDRGSGLKGFTQNLAKNINLYGEMHRFIPDYASVYGAKMIEFDVDFQDRDYGVSAYKGSKRTVKVLLDIVTLAFMIYFAKKPFLLMPGRLFGFTGAVITGLGGLAGLYLLVLKIMGENIGNRPLLITAVLMIIVGLQFLMTGFLGELMMRVYFEATGRKTYTVREIL